MLEASPYKRNTDQTKVDVKLLMLARIVRLKVLDAYQKGGGKQ
jgi:hypothetical protein